MLEGMANHQARAVRARAGGLLLYAPVVRAEDFHSAIAYLVRRLDENTAPENFLRHVFDLEPGSPAWNMERDRFLAAFGIKAALSDAPRRTQDRSTEARARPVPRPLDARFENDPDTDWTLAQNRAWIEDVVDRWRGALAGGHPAPGRRGASRRARGRRKAAIPRGRAASPIATRWAGRADVDRALTVARAAQPAWAGHPATERDARLEACAAELNRRRGDLIGAMILDGAKTVTEADAEVSEAVDFARYYARTLRETAGELADCRMEPLGVVVVTPPWNFPLSIPAGGVLAALAAGNAVILKPAPEAVLVGWWLARCLWDAGVPRDVLQFLPCPDDETGKALVTDPRVGAVILTGSVETARLFLGWRPDLPLFAETSGKNAVIITALADRDQAIRDLVRSAFGHNGQKCSAASLAICEAEVYDDPDFRRQLRDAAASLAVGSAWELGSRVTPLTQAPGAALRRALTVLDEGEEWLLEPRPARDNPQLWSPGIKLGVRPGSFFHRTECFGPVLGLMRAEDLDQAIALANATPFGLTSGIQTLDDREIAHWVDRLDAGTLYVNRPITGAIVGRQPFGGWKASSVGPGAKAGGPNYVLQLGRWRQVTPPPGDGEPLPEPLAALLERCLAELPRRRRARAPASQRGELRTRVAPPLRPRARSRRDPRRAERVSIPTVPARDRAGNRRVGARALPGGAGGLRGRRALDGEPGAGLTVRGVARRKRRGDARGGSGGRVRGAPGASGGRGARAGLGADLDRGPRRRQRRRPHRHRRARPRQRTPRAPLVPPRADGLAGAAPLWQRHGAGPRRVIARGRIPKGPLGGFRAPTQSLTCQSSPTRMLAAGPSVLRLPGARRARSDAGPGLVPCLSGTARRSA